MSAPQILQLRIELQHIVPLIWRRVQIPEAYSFWDLHVAIQSAFGWNDSHLHVFEVRQQQKIWRFGIPLDDDDFREPGHRPLPGWEHQVSKYLTRKSPVAAYNYDFGDDWQHVVTLEEHLIPAPGKKYPRCTAGERAGPPDDCGGPGGYQDLLEILSDRNHEEHESSHRWAASIKGVRGRFDPEAFDEQGVRFASPRSRLRRLLESAG